MFSWNVVRQTLPLSSVILKILRVVTTDMHHFTTGIRSEKCVVRRCCYCANVMKYTYTNQYSIAYYTIWYCLLLLGYKPVQHVTVLNTVGNCNTMVSIIIL
jgi:hypothetical protein